MTTPKESRAAIPIWDQPRDGPGTPPSLSPKQWRLRNDASLARKVEEIEEACRSPSKVAQSLPRNHKDLRGRHIPELRQWSWSGREVDDKNGRNAPLVARLHAAWDALAKAEAATKQDKLRQPGLREQLDAARKTADALGAQVIQLLRERNGRGPISDDDRR